MIQQDTKRWHWNALAPFLVQRRLIHVKSLISCIMWCQLASETLAQTLASTKTEEFTDIFRIRKHACRTHIKFIRM